MKQCIRFICIGLLLTSCVQYRYHLPVTNAVLFKNQGETHLAADIGTSAISFKGAYAATDKIGITAMYNSSFGESFSSENILSKEGELGFGFYTPADPIGLFVQWGMAYGANTGYSDSTLSVKSFEGTFYRPFVQLNTGVSLGTLYKGLKANVIFSLKVNGLMYDGRHLDGTNDPIRARYVTTEPAVTLGLGTRRFQLEYYIGMPLRPLAFLEANNRSDARTFPMTIGVGLHFILGRE